MGRGKRGRVRGAAARRQRAITAANRLSEVLDNPWQHSDATVNAAASQLWRVSRRHRIKIQSKNRIWICRGCNHHCDLVSLLGFEYEVECELRLAINVV